ncbi:alpha/beta fold hydrolase [Sphingomonas daechungensis]|uniref:Alpha/beta fold hydrolase n=1 Tax=Sphingomonas daechungensis TaxID=1176646 RepID=A0ABX6T5W2_9SPHN|nr:alpha/beta fold hydrolase [Sphingomonas daechungensis]
MIVISAAKPLKQPQALFDLDGGPGLADTKNAGFYLTDGTAYAETRDIVLIDQRGTGGSNPLDCPEFDAPDKALQPMFPVAAVQSCRARLSRSADLTRYTTDDAVADLDDVRRALGYAKIDLFALSYGTTLALRYVQRHENRVRSAVLLSAVPPSAMPPRHHATAAQPALDQLIADCAADASCSSRYPNLRARLKEALDKLQISAKVTPSVAMERLRTKLYSPGGARSEPNLIDRLAKGDISVLWSENERAGFNYFDGVYLTITCSESLPFFDETEARKNAQKTVFGDYRLTRQREACANWPRAQVKNDFFEPVRARVPVLFLSGNRDPVTPGKWAEEAAQGLPNSRLIVITWAGHIVDGLTGLDSCFDPQVVRFLETADPKSVDDRCFASMMPPPFKM